MAASQIATIKHLVCAAGWEPSLQQPRPGREDYEAGLKLAERKGLVVDRNGRAYVPYQRFVRRSLRRHPKDPG